MRYIPVMDRSLSTFGGGVIGATIVTALLMTEASFAAWLVVGLIAALIVAVKTAD